MSKPNITIHNLETGEITVREMTDDEFAQWEIDSARRAKEIAAEAANEKKKQDILERLGLTDEELKTLLS